MLGYLESLFCVVCVYLVQQSLTVFWREERLKIIETITFEIPISISMGFAVYKYLLRRIFKITTVKRLPEHYRAM